MRIAYEYNSQTLLQRHGFARIVHGRDKIIIDLGAQAPRNPDVFETINYAFDHTADQQTIDALFHCYSEVAYAIDAQRYQSTPEELTGKLTDILATMVNYTNLQKMLHDGKELILPDMIFPEATHDPELAARIINRDDYKVLAVIAMMAKLAYPITALLNDRFPGEYGAERLGDKVFTGVVVVAPFAAPTMVKLKAFTDRFLPNVAYRHQLGAVDEAVVNRMYTTLVAHKFARFVPFAVNNDIMRYARQCLIDAMKVHSAVQRQITGSDIKLLGNIIPEEDLAGEMPQDYMVDPSLVDTVASVTGRSGAKGVVCRIVPDEELPEDAGKDVITHPRAGFGGGEFFVHDTTRRGLGMKITPHRYIDNQDPPDEQQ